MRPISGDDCTIELDRFITCAHGFKLSAQFGALFFQYQVKYCALPLYADLKTLTLRYGKR